MIQGYVCEGLSDSIDSPVACNLQSRSVDKSLTYRRESLRYVIQRNPNRQPTGCGSEPGETNPHFLPMLVRRSCRMDSGRSFWGRRCLAAWPSSPGWSCSRAVCRRSFFIPRANGMSMRCCLGSYRR